MRAKPGEKGSGEYYRIVVRPKSEFKIFRIHDVGRKGHIQRLAGKRASGSWDTQAWLISKKDALLKNRKLVPLTSSARKILRDLRSIPKYKRGDIFEAKPRKNIPEKAKPTKAQKTARRKNIRKAQKARLGGRTRW